MVDLGKVVVFRSQPEDGGVRMACCRCLARMSHGGRSLEWRKKRSAEESHLLAGHHRSRALAKRSKRRCRGRGRRGILLRSAAEPAPANAPEPADAPPGRNPAGSVGIGRPRRSFIRRSSPETAGSVPAQRSWDNNLRSAIHSLPAIASGSFDPRGNSMRSSGNHCLKDATPDGIDAQVHIRDKANPQECVYFFFTRHSKRGHNARRRRPPSRRKPKLPSPRRKTPQNPSRPSQ